MTGSQGERRGPLPGLGWGLGYLSPIATLLRWFACATARMRRRWRYVAFDYNRGYSVRLSAQGIEAEEVTAHFWACGLAVLFRPGDPRPLGWRPERAQQS